ncbi:hypothetical protein ACJ6WF_16040 [Streptomyces sp. MMS24-I2-30]|uniref:hypothetical protein n=1 Tax=Streptomyces sp. MMS24-I2-30 TaxID=3351564 RepID=UPI003896C27F
MIGSYSKRSIVSVSALLLALAPVGLQQASAVTPSQTHASAPAAPSDRSDYQDGFKSGYRTGYSDAKDDCKMEHGARHGHGFKKADDYSRGWGDGYSAGYAKAEDRYC